MPPENHGSIPTDHHHVRKPSAGKTMFLMDELWMESRPFRYGWSHMPRTATRRSRTAEQMDLGLICGDSKTRLADADLDATFLACAISTICKAHTLVNLGRTSRTTASSDIRLTLDRVLDYPYPSRAKVVLIMFSLYISIFLVALDRTIIGPAIPEITNQFHSLDDVGWYGSAYMLTACGFILLYGRVYTFFNTKWVFLSGIFLFEIGSAVCGAAPSSMILIIGRAIAGLGSSGIFTGAILIMLQIVPLHRRPMLQGLFGACFGVASVTGPLLGGAFTGSKATWRWCFYINLPLGAITVVVAIIFVNLNESKPVLTWKQIFWNLDPFGTLLFVPSITCLLLALEWGGTEYEWSEPRMIALLVVFAVLFLSFIALQYLTRRSTATVPARIIFQRSVAFGGISQFFVGSTMLTVSIYLPIWFQAIKDATAMRSGIMMIPLVLSVVVGSIVSGGLVQRFGYYTPFMIFGSVCMSVGTGLLTTWNSSTSSAEWIGYQILIGIGVGSSMQHPNLAVQVVLPKEDIPSGTALLSFAQTLGGAIFVAVGQNVFIDKFTAALGDIHGIDPARILHQGATGFRKGVPDFVIPRVVEAYNYSLVKGTFFAALIVACLSFLAAIGMEWRSVKEGMQERPTGENHSNDLGARHSARDDEEMNAEHTGLAGSRLGDNGEAGNCIIMRNESHCVPF
ncbi:major facilitator superfamily domain-containing protein [Clohesyomyces aquaticus]|uniref:Major facilitator superfamily domain-containing protein n=1 Tax=Clohesyomyces aquaticus TaxID=1231657 RepID=A0A1Y1YUS6_9PLEO|nr:major facilitator superfamily domain-containing protein [Clohesyomyces aquaticus]